MGNLTDELKILLDLREEARKRKDKAEYNRLKHRVCFVRNKKKIIKKNKDWRIKNKQKVLAQERARYHARREEKRLINNAWYEKNKERILEKRKQKRSEQRMRSKRHYEKNIAAYIERNIKRRLAEKMAIPKWLTDKQKLQIKKIYKAAKVLEKKTGKKWHVDHKVPLRSEIVCGLHVPWNLQVLTAEENIKKSNKI